MRKFTAADYRAMPWKNGGGVTTELAIAPAGAGLDDFDWRISSAQVGAAGPFSRFAGIDRSLAIMDGTGLALRIAHGATVRLTPADAPFAFAGELEVGAELLDGAVTDFNVMTRRGRWRHRLQCITLIGDAALRRDADRLFMYCAAGSVGCRPHDAAQAVGLMAGETLLSSDGDEPQLTLTTADSALLYVVYLTLEGKNCDD